MIVQDGFLYLIVTRHKLTVWVGREGGCEVSGVDRGEGEVEPV